MILERVLALLGLPCGKGTVRNCLAAAGEPVDGMARSRLATFDARAQNAFLAVARDALEEMNYQIESESISAIDARPPAGQEEAEALANEAALRAAAENDRENSKAQFRFAYFLWRQGRLGEALPLLERTLVLAPDNYFAANVLTMTLSRLDRTDEAIITGQRALALKDKAACAFVESRPALKALRITHVEKKFSEDPRRNVISFSLWGDNPMYTEGAVLNVEIARYMYPCWVCRFYVDGTVPPVVLDRLRALGAQVVFVPPDERGPHGGPWRFYAADDTSIDRFISRDCDSRLNTQERMAVDEWVMSGKAVHIMRDHVWHNELILAGMWGAITGALPPLKPLIASGRWFGKSRWYDQFFLWGVVWPLAREDHLAHDSFFRLGNARPFPAVGRVPSTSHVGGTVRNV